MSSMAVFLSVIAAVFIGAASPGPSFVLVSRIAVSRSRKAGLAAALGMGTGSVIFATLALFGLSALLMKVEWLYLALKVAGGLYLIYVGVRIWRGAADDLPIDSPATPKASGAARNFLFALGTQLSNPKTAIFYGSIFAALLPAAPAPWLLAAVPLAVFLVETGWYTVVTIAFSSNRPRAIYLGAKLWIDRVAGVVMGALGARLVAEGLPRHLWR
ncbi:MULTISPECIES: LysE family translocator [unclassified Rhizobium]|uniref:LysE family translocator n=1 Tax=unclassified Rhizobium TaxID=2613769 RepID=UPI000DDD1932|nr:MULTISPECIES: LysE family translocator [unclassified Rhizobium]MBB3290756.1 threonine/homoserine/homoserine lactone efflux protein [Rhizobium sp. BK252]MBB3405536.1 threonine/homoserine/homoserine lactone efflux protein [Rhizobium sp. BK289]MBB3418174.1 threonine/homoserine/homoserine lactone efflux protein [Rhizobium sp. BK284]MBB3486053.1 threonine/homoserine/homoserine lactone efflux protein [Rhizobium sp. BK347]MDK4721363.1 LysE family translocator [Rhizobium sp. CNPSo 3968]